MQLGGLLLKRFDTGISLLPQRLMGILTPARSAGFSRRDGWRNVAVSLIDERSKRVVAWFRQLRRKARI